MSRLKSIAMLFNQKAEINEKLINQLKNIATEISPYQKGDIVTIKGYSHQGKKARVEFVYLRIDDDRSSIRLGYKGTVLKKDGTDSNYDVNVSSLNDNDLKTCLDNFIKRDTGIDIRKGVYTSLKEITK